MEPVASDAWPDRLIVGLGNPGPEYVDTRHNVGFRVVERLAERHGAGWRRDAALDGRIALVAIAGAQCLLLEPSTFVNASGRAVDAALRRWPGLDPGRDLLVVYDDLDLPTGRIRLRPAGGAGGHNGMRHIQSTLGRRDLPRLRFGVGHPGEAGAVIDWVLGPFDEAEQAQVEAAIERAADAIEAVLADDLPAAMGRFNAVD